MRKLLKALFLIFILFTLNSCAEQYKELGVHDSVVVFKGDKKIGEEPYKNTTLEVKEFQVWVELYGSQYRVDKGYFIPREVFEYTKVGDTLKVNLYKYESGDLKVSILNY